MNVISIQNLGRDGLKVLRDDCVIASTDDVADAERIASAFRDAARSRPDDVGTHDEANAVREALPDLAECIG